MTYAADRRGPGGAVSPGPASFGLPLYYTAPPDAGPSCEQPGTDIADTLFLTATTPPECRVPRSRWTWVRLQQHARLWRRMRRATCWPSSCAALALALTDAAQLPSTRRDRWRTFVVAMTRPAPSVFASWTATLSIDGTVSPPPCWLAATNDVTHFDIVLGGKAYLLYHQAAVNSSPQAPCDQYAELVLANGTSCGFIDITGTKTCSRTTVAVGLDGTLSAIEQASCTISFWPRAFAAP